jgi:2-succinyl-6-hydroxy-2,4-cyclohexadiene-1-carboxylate synthase
LNRVFVHGFVGSPDDFRTLDLPGVALTLPGHHPSEPVEATFDFERVADRLLVRAHANERIHLVGYSLGARLALSIAIRHPQSVGRLTLIGVHPGLEDPDERTERAKSDEAWANLLETEGLDAFLERWHAQPLLQTRRPRPDRSHHDPHALAFALRRLGLARMPSYWSRLRGLIVPTELVVGEDDTKFGAIAECARALIRLGKLIRIPDAGHNVLVDQPEALREVLVVNTSP